MKEVYGDAWIIKKDYTFLAITSNGYVKRNGEAVMGRGIAAQAKYKYPNIAYKLGGLLTRQGNRIHVLAPDLISFPVKHHWAEKADIRLIRASAHELMSRLGEHETVLLPRPGCGNGGLNWKDVKPILEKILDDRVAIVHWRE